MDLIKQPELLEKPHHACMSAAWFWASRGLNTLSDTDQFDKITQRINGGQNGAAERQALFAQALEVIALEQWLAASDQAHYRALTNEQTKQARLRDRLATTDLRLSVLLDATAAIGCDRVQTTTGTGGVVYGTARAQLDPAHAQRIIGIAGDGDQGLIALPTCQDYVRQIHQ